MILFMMYQLALLKYIRDVKVASYYRPRRYYIEKVRDCGVSLFTRRCVCQSGKSSLLCVCLAGYMGKVFIILICIYVSIDSHH